MSVVQTPAAWLPPGNLFTKQNLWSTCQTCWIGICILTRPSPTTTPRWSAAHWRLSISRLDHKGALGPRETGARFLNWGTGVWENGLQPCPQVRWWLTYCLCGRVQVHSQHLGSRHCLMRFHLGPLEMSFFLLLVEFFFLLKKITWNKLYRSWANWNINAENSRCNKQLVTYEASEDQWVANCSAC